MKKLFLASLALIIGLALLIDNSFFKSIGRGLASVDGGAPADSEDSIDLSPLSETDFNRAFKYKLVTPLAIVTAENSMGVQLGNFYIHGTDEQKIFVCSKYNVLELTFEAEGIAVSGNIPRMTVRGPCQTSEDFKSIQALSIPVQSILASPVQQTEFQVASEESQDKTSIVFHYPADSWPKQWNLVGIKLYSDYSTEVLAVTGYEIISILGQPFTLQW